MVETKNGCELLDTFAVILQAFLAFIALSTLLCNLICFIKVKRHREFPKRPFMVWLFDTSKQAVGAGFIHFLNILISFIIGEGSPTSKNPCVWYFLNVLVDTTIGVFILLFWLKVMDFVVHLNGIPDMTSGIYGNPPQLRIWLRQLMGFSLCLILTKIVVIIVLQFKFLSSFASVLIDPIQDPHVQIVFVMLIFPLIMNILQFWIVDSLIRANSWELIQQDAEAGNRSEENLIAVNDDDEDVLALQPPTLERLVHIPKKQSSHLDE